MNKLELRFLGATQTVTGSQSLINIHDDLILIDSGLYQGAKKLEEDNFRELSVEPSEVKAIFLTHAHLDHSGFLPVLVKKGFHGQIYCSEATQKLVQIILEDSAHIQSYAYKKGETQELLYDEVDVAKTLQLITPIEFNRPLSFSKYKVSAYRAGHILGAASYVFEVDKKKICFTGDIGRTDDSIHKTPEVPENLTHLIIESTYGDRLHSQQQAGQVLEKAIIKIRTSQGTLLIPAFAVARTQVILYEICKVFKENPHLKIPVYMDSKMGINATRVYQKYSEELKINDTDWEEMLDIVKLVEFPKDKTKINEKKSPSILISSSGMISGGKAIEHFERLGRKDMNIVLLTGYQGEGTIGRRVYEGEHEFFLNKRWMRLDADVMKIESLSAHADRDGLYNYIRENEKTLTKIYLNHGEEEVVINFKKFLNDKMNIPIINVDKNIAYELEDN